MNAEDENERAELILHSERITISDGRYLIFYTFEPADTRSTDKPDTAEKE